MFKYHVVYIDKTNLYSKFPNTLECMFKYHVGYIDKTNLYSKFPDESMTFLHHKPRELKPRFLLIFGQTAVGVYGLRSFLHKNLFLSITFIRLLTSHLVLILLSRKLNAPLMLHMWRLRVQKTGLV